MATIQSIPSPDKPIVPTFDAAGNPVYPPYNDNKLSLTENLIKRLHAKLFYERVKNSNYNINYASGILTYSGANMSEQASINNLASICRAEAKIIAEEMLDWISAAKRGLFVIVDHGSDAADPYELVTKHTTSPNMSTKRWIIQPGEDSVPKGIEI